MLISRVSGELRAVEVETGFSPLYQFGGPRSVQFALKLHLIAAKNCFLPTRAIRMILARVPLGSTCEP